jgi:hypothetical protein
MANPTTNFGWVMPTSTSLVTNLPADFNTFGQAVDTSMSELLGGTTGQVLSKTSNTNMDFTWVTPTDQTPLTTKGDLFTFSTVDARLAVGTNGQTLVADSTAATGLKWATPSGGKVLQVVSVNYSTATTSTTTSLIDSGLTATITPTLATSKIFVVITQGVRALRDTNQPQQVEWRALRGATNISGVDYKFDYQKSTDSSGRTALNVPLAFTILDAPATTSATTYKTQFCVSYTANNGQATTQPAGTTSTITLLEIGA